MSDPSTALSHFRNYEKVKVSEQEFERRLRNKDLPKGGVPETSGLLRKKGQTPALPVFWAISQPSGKAGSARGLREGQRVSIRGGASEGYSASYKTGVAGAPYICPGLGLPLRLGAIKLLKPDALPPRLSSRGSLAAPTCLRGPDQKGS